MQAIIIFLNLFIDFIQILTFLEISDFNFEQHHYLLKETFHFNSIKLINLMEIKKVCSEVDFFDLISDFDRFVAASYAVEDLDHFFKKESDLYFVEADFILFEGVEASIFIALMEEAIMIDEIINLNFKYLQYGFIVVNL